MSKYSKLSKILHNQFLNNGEITDYFIKRLKIKSNQFDLTNIENIFITGLARSGTTALLQALDSSGEVASLRYKYMPFILSPKIASIYSKFVNSKIKISERIHGDGLMVGPGSPECLDEPFWINNLYKFKTFDRYLEPHSFNRDIAKIYGYLLNSYLKIEGKNRLIIKNNNNHLRLLSLSKFFPKSKILVLFRSPCAHAKSLLNLHERLIKAQDDDDYVLSYMNLLGHWEFGKGKKPFVYKKTQAKVLDKLSDQNFKYWLTQWIYSYEWILDIATQKNKPNLVFICYEDVCENLNYKKRLMEKLEISDKKINFKFRLGKSNSKKVEHDFDLERINYAEEIYQKLRKKSFSCLSI